jgi:hypothetical protein
MTFKKNTKNAVEILSIMVFSPESMGFLWDFLWTPRGKGRPQDLGEDAAARAAEAPAASVWTVDFRWIGGLVNRRWTIFLEDFRGFFFEMLGKPWKTQVF